MKYPILFILILSVIIFSCKEKEPTAPEEEKPQESLVEETIGVTGGIIYHENLIIEIPPGTFFTDNKISIAEEKDSIYRESSVTPTYRIEGLPNSFKNSIRIAIKYSGALSNENYIAIGEKATVKSLSQVLTTYCYIEASDSAGFLVANLSLPDEFANYSSAFLKSSNIWKWIYAVGVSNVVSFITSDGHFRIHSEANKISTTQNAEIALNLEKAYSVFIEKGFNYERRTKWPIPVFIRFLDYAWGYYTGTRFLGDHGYIVISSDIFDYPEILRATCGHEFLHFVQDLYDPRGWEIKLGDFGTHYWLSEATAIFSEEFFVENPNNYISSNLYLNRYAPFKGFHLEGKIAGEHGYGMASIIKYLNKRFLSSQLVNLYSDIFLGKHPVDAIIFNSDETTDWVSPFFRDYIEGKVYNIHPQIWIDSIKGDKTFKVETASDTVKRFDYQYQDLSAELFNIELKYKNWAENTRIYFTLLDNKNPFSEISVYKYSPSYLLEYLASDTSQVLISDINKLTSENCNLIGLVTNKKAQSPFTSKTQINLQLDVKEPSDILKKYKQAFIDLHVKGFHIRTTADSSYEDPYYEFYETYSPGQISSLSGTTFSSSWSDSREEDYPEERTTVTWNGSINIVFSEDFQEIISYSETNLESWPGWRTTNMSVSVKNIPFNYGDKWSGDKYLLDLGEETCDYVVSRSYNTTWWDGKSFIFSRNECDEESYIKITLYSE